MMVPDDRVKKSVVVWSSFPFVMGEFFSVFFALKRASLMIPISFLPVSYSHIYLNSATLVNVFAFDVLV